jgi:hypothetical protein
MWLGTLSGNQFLVPHVEFSPTHVIKQPLRSVDPPYATFVGCDPHRRQQSCKLLSGSRSIRFLRRAQFFCPPEPAFSLLMLYEW